MYHVDRLPFRVSSAPSVFQPTMKNILQGLLGGGGGGCWIYIDDILVTGKTRPDHNANLEAVLTRQEEAGVRLKREKCSFAMPSVEFLVHIS